MKKYIGTKILNAKPMTKLEYNVLRGWEQPQDEDPNEEGYLVEYLDGGKPCHPGFDNYISWSPKEVFEKAYKQSGNMSFGDAITYLKKGNKVARKGWNGKGMYLELQSPDANSKMTLPYIYIKTVQDDLVPWLASQTDVLAEDWGIVE